MKQKGVMYMTRSSLILITLITLSPVYVVMLCFNLRCRSSRHFVSLKKTSKPFWSLLFGCSLEAEESVNTLQALASACQFPAAQAGP